MASWPGCFWDCGKVAPHGSECVTERSCSPHGQDMKEGEGGKSRGSTTLSKGKRKWLEDLALALLLSFQHLLINSAELHTKFLIRGPLKIFQIQI
jgi:hypothetical protein